MEFGLYAAGLSGGTEPKWRKGTTSSMAEKAENLGIGPSGVGKTTASDIVKVGTTTTVFGGDATTPAAAADRVVVPVPPPRLQ